MRFRLVVLGMISGCLGVADGADGGSAGGGTSGAGGGSTAGGMISGGSTAGGSAGGDGGGRTAGGSTAGGSTAGGSMAGGSAAGGSTAGGSTAGGSTAGGSTAGGVSGAYVNTDPLYDALYDAAFAALTPSSVKYVSTTGSDSANGNSLSTAYASVNHALAQVGPNALIWVDDGTYSVGMSGWVNERTGTPIPSGTGAGWTVIRAIHPGSVTISQSAQSYYGSLLRAENAQRVWIDGFNFFHDARHDDEPIFLTGDTWRITRSMFRRRQSGTYGATFFLGRGSLVQDCAFAGAGRYMLNTGANSGNSIAGTNVFRRVVARLDWALGNQPIATFAHYGSDDAAWVDSKQTLFANCIDVDSPAVENQGVYGFRWAAFYHPKHQRDLRHRGCIVLNAGANFAAFRTDNIGSPTMSASDCAVWDNDNNTQPGQQPGGWVRESGTFTVDHLTAGMILGADTSGTTNVSAANHRFSDSMTNLLQRVNGNGAEILYAHGAFLSHWGEAGFDSITTTPLWPWPYEARIKAWMDTQVTRPAGHFPATPAMSRQSFAGQSLSGAPQTLTRRIWEATGTPMPDLRTVY